MDGEEGGGGGGRGRERERAERWGEGAGGEGAGRRGEERRSFDQKGSFSGFTTSSSPPPGSSSRACSWLCSFHPLWVRSSVIHHGVLELRRLRLLVDSPLSLTELLASCLQHHPVWSCSLHVLRLPPRAARVEGVVLSRSCNATLLSRALLLRSSWHSMSRPPWHSMALRRRITRALVSTSCLLVHVLTHVFSSARFSRARLL